MKKSSKKCGCRHPGRKSCEDRSGGWVCTLVKGHVGSHVACGNQGHVLEHWPQDEGGRIILAVVDGEVSLVDAPEGTQIELREYGVGEFTNGRDIKKDVDGYEYRESFL